MNFKTWLKTFLSEKQFKTQYWDITDSDGTLHMIDSNFVVEAILGAPAHEQRAIKTMLVKIDFVNGNIGDYFKHLAGALVRAW